MKKRNNVDWIPIGLKEIVFITQSIILTNGLNILTSLRYLYINVIFLIKNLFTKSALYYGKEFEQGAVAQKAFAENNKGIFK